MSKPLPTECPPVKDRLKIDKRLCFGQSNLARPERNFTQTQKTELLLVRRRVFTSSLLCLTDTNGLVTSNSRLTFNLFVRTTSTYICPDAFYLADIILNLRKLRSERIIHGRADIIPLLTLSLEAYKESRQKRLAVKHREYKFKTAILHCFSIDTAANNARIYYFNSINLDSLNSRKHTTYVRLKRNRPSRRIRVTARTVRNLTGERRQRCFGRSKKEDNLTSSATYVCTCCCIDE